MKHQFENFEIPYYRLGEKFEYNGNIYKPVQSSELGCYGCCFAIKCDHRFKNKHCVAPERKDCNSVIYHVAKKI